MTSQVPLERHLPAQDVDERPDIHCGNTRVLHTVRCSQSLPERTLLLSNPMP